jgi:hypothetical protein
VPDDEGHQQFERIDAQSRWAGVALVGAQLLGSTAAMLGDWDLQSTLLRRTLQEGARRIAVEDVSGEPLLVDNAAQLEDFQRKLLTGSRRAGTDWVARYLLPLVEDFATEQLLRTKARPAWLIWAALGLTIAGAACFLRGWLGAGLVALTLSMPLDLLASRLAAIRLRPLAVRMWSKLALWPAAGIALLALGWWEARHNSGWGAFVTAAAAIAFAEAGRIERSLPSRGELWLFSRRSAIVLAVPFAIAGSWTAYLVALLVYAAASFFIVQHVRHSAAS